MTILMQLNNSVMEFSSLMIANKSSLGSDVSVTRRSDYGPRLLPVHDGAVAVYGISLRGDDSPSDFGRLILITRSNEQYLGQLDALNVRIGQAQTNWTTPAVRGG